MTNGQRFQNVFGKDYEFSDFEKLGEDWWNKEFRMPGATYEWKGHKCGECQNLNLEHKTSCGYKCERPNYKHRGRTAHLKYKTTPACKGFVPKEVNND